MPLSTVGSFPKPPFLAEARLLMEAGEVPPEEFAEKAREATEFWIKTQEDAGVDVLVDGEQYRNGLVSFFAENMKGFQPGGIVRCHDGRYCRRPVISGTVRWRKAITVERWEHAQGLTSKPVKGVVTGPYTMMDWSFNEWYVSRRAAALALAREIRKEVVALIDAGCKIVQVDEPALGARPEELRIAVDALEIVTGRLPAYFILHACYGGFESIYPGMLNIPVHNFSFEMANSGFGLLGVLTKRRPGQDLSAGVCDIYGRKLGSADVIERRIKRVVKALDPDQIWVTPDCGLEGRTVDEAVALLKSMRSAVNAVRKDLDI